MGETGGIALTLHFAFFLAVDGKWFPLMIIWSGNGILIPIVAILGGFVGSFAFNFVNLSPRWMSVFVIWGAALFLLLYARTFGKTRYFVMTEAGTNQPSLAKRRHTLFFIPAFFWAIAAILVASFFTFVELKMPADVSEKLDGAAKTEVSVEADQAMTPPLPLDRSSSEPPKVDPVLEVDPPGTMREWTSLDGRVMTAALMKFPEETDAVAEFLREDGKVYQIRTEKLSEADQAEIRRMFQIIRNGAH